MLNITKLKIWPALQSLNFEPVKFRGQGRQLMAIGARVLTKKGHEIVIEPASYSDRKNYHITGHYQRFICRELYTYNNGHKEKIYSTDTFVNEYFKASKILNQVINMLKETNDI